MSLARVDLLFISVYGGFLVLMVLLIRHLLKKVLPRRVFSILWCVALLRLLIPFSLEVPYGGFSPLQDRMSALRYHVPTDGEGLLAQMFLEAGFSGDMPKSPEGGGGMEAEGLSDRMPVTAAGGISGIGAGIGIGGISYIADRTGTGGIAGYRGGTVGMWKVSLLQKIGMAGTALLAAVFLTLYLHCLGRFRTALPMEDPAVERWLGQNRLRRKVQVCCCDRISSPLTYGLLHPVILLPKRLGQEGECGMTYILQHEMVHIRRFDGAWKLVMAAALCLHWFNPLVWVLYVFMNRDLELACDEEVLRIFGRDARKGYALTLIGMEENRLLMTPLYSGFGKNAVEERLGEIMKYRKKTKTAVGIGAALVLAVVCISATTSRAGEDPGEAVGMPQEDDSVSLPMDPPTGNFLENDGANGDVGSGTEAVPETENGTQGEGVYRLTYMKEGMPESEPAQLVQGQGYTILLPQEGWISFGPDGWMNEDNNKVEIWVGNFSAEDSDYRGLGREQIEEELMSQGYQSDGGHYWKYAQEEDRMTVVELRQDDGQDIWGIFYTYPGDGEDGWGVELRAMAQTFYTVPGSGSGGEETDEEVRLMRWLIVRLVVASGEKGHDSILPYIAEGYEVDTECLDVIREWKQSEISVRQNPASGHSIVSIRVVTEESVEDSNDYLTVELIPDGEEWKICFMGIEK